MFSGTFLDFMWGEFPEVKSHDQAYITDMEFPLLLSILLNL